MKENRTLMDYSIFFFSLFMFLSVFFPSDIYFQIRASLALFLQTQSLFYSILCQVTELKSELKLRSLPVSGTKTDLIKRLRTHQELNRGSGTTPSPTAGCTEGPGAEGAEQSPNSAATTTNNTSEQKQHRFQLHQASSPTGQSGDDKLICLIFHLMFLQHGKWEIYDISSHLSLSSTVKR